jgi:hypothetical protein
MCESTMGRKREEGGSSSGFRMRLTPCFSLGNSVLRYFFSAVAGSLIEAENLNQAARFNPG